jgi:hypothetical protein
MLRESPEELRERLFSKTRESYQAATEFAQSEEDRRNVYFPEVSSNAKRVIPDPSLPLSLPLLFEEQIILDIFPYRTREEFIEMYGLAPEHLRTLIDEGAIRLNVLDSPKELPGVNQTALDAFDDAEVDYSPLINSELIGSEMLYSVEHFNLCNPDWTEKLRSGLEEARSTSFFGSDKLDRVFLNSFAERIGQQEGVRSSPMKTKPAKVRAFKDILQLSHALGYDDIINEPGDLIYISGLDSLNRLEQREWRTPFPTIQTSKRSQAYRQLVKGQNESSALPNMKAFPTDLTQSLIEFGGWDKWAGQDDFGGLYFRKLDPSQDSVGTYFDEFLELRREVQNSSAIELYQDCRELFKTKNAGEASRLQIDEGKEANEELQDIFQSYETVDRWSGTALKVTGATIAANGIKELAVPLKDVVTGGLDGGAEAIREVGGSVGEEIPEEFKQKIKNRARETGIYDSVESQIQNKDENIVPFLSNQATNLTAEEVVGRTWRNYLWRPAKRGELELFSETKLRKYENQSELRSRLIPFIISSEARKSELK